MKMRICLSVLLAGLLVVSTASAQTITWQALESASVAGNTPGNDGLVGTGDDGTTPCNYQPTLTDCGTSGTTPTIGAYSINVLDWGPAEQCNFTGSACICNDGSTSCNVAAGDTVCPETGGSCSGTGTAAAGDCCPSPLSECINCPTDQAVSYFAAGGLGSNSGTLVMTQASGGHTPTLFDMATTESLAGNGGGCLQLATGGSQPNGGTGCGIGAISGYIDVGVFVGGCSGSPTFGVDDISYDGYVYAIGSSPAAGACGYSQAELNAIGSDAPGTAVYILVLCGNVTLPNAPVPCFGGSDVDFVTVAYTADDVTICP